MMTAGLRDKSMGGWVIEQIPKRFFLPKQVPIAEFLRESTFRVNLESDRLRNFLTSGQGMKQADLARIWGVSPAYVCKLVGRGMPLASLEDADLWRVENLEKPPRSESGGAVVRGLCEVVGGDEEGLMEDTIEARVKRCRQVEKLAFQLVRENAEGGNAIAVRSAIHAHCEAQKRTMEAELVLAKKVEAEEWKNNPNNILRDWVVPEL